MKMVCDKAIRCPGPYDPISGVDFPVANFSSEKPDKTIFIFTGFGPGGQEDGEDDGGTDFPNDPNCVAFTTSTTSQTDAEICATVSQRQCVNGFPVDTENINCTTILSNPNPPTGPTGGGGGGGDGGGGNPPIVVVPFDGFSPLGDEFDGQIIVTGSDPPFTFEVTDGSLPPGLTLNDDGSITGTPTDPGYFHAEVTVTDSNGNTDTVTVDITVLGISTDTLPDGTAGDFYSTILISGGGAITFTVTDGVFPPGLTLDNEGNITGTPTVPGDYTFTITVTDEFGRTASKTFHIHVNPSGCPSWGTLVWGALNVTSDPGAPGTPSGIFGGSAFSFSASTDNATDSEADCTGVLTYIGPACNCNLHLVATVAAGPDFGRINVQIVVGPPGFSQRLTFPAGDIRTTGPNVSGTYDFPFTVPDTGGVPTTISVQVSFLASLGAVLGSVSGNGVITNI